MAGIDEAMVTVTLEVAEGRDPERGLSSEDREKT